MVGVKPYVLKTYGVPWQMLLPYIMADVIAMLCVLFLKRVGSYANTNVTRWSVMKSILDSQQEHLLRGSKNI